MRTARTAATYALAGVLLAWILAACGASSRETAIHDAYAGAEAARAGFVRWDLDHQKAIVASAKDAAGGRVELDAYRGKRIRIVSLFEGVYRAIAGAAVVNADPGSLASMVTAATVLYDEIKLLEGTP